ncbi:ceramide synthase 4-like [Macrotis lagotis]|uniref:ceramide synthase 4-like n=1 Tax=Macrotis lagotis TaxID=92651 RepID=UPI003D68AA03
MLTTLYKSFWKDEYWFPPGYTWADLEDSDGITYPHPKDLLTAIPLIFVLLIFRFILERAIGLPLSKVLGVRDTLRIKVTPNPILESFFQTRSKNPKKDELGHLASQCNLSVRQAERWFRCRRNQERPLLTKKFTESFWKFSFYSCSFFGGLFTLYNETWFSQPETTWIGYPKQPLQFAIKWWYILEFSFYLSLILTLCFDVKRKDFKEQVIHHFMAIILLSYSYSANIVRIGVQVLLLHNVSDIFLELGKMLSYAGWRITRDVLFIIFSLVFLISRLIVFPYKVFYISYHIFKKNNQFFFGYYFGNAFLLVVMCLNIFWSVLIVKMFLKLLLEGQFKCDVRSDVEEEEDDMSDEKLTKSQRSNGRLQLSRVTDVRARVVRGTDQLASEAVPMT